MSWLTFFWIFFKASLLSSGGRGPFPALYGDLTARGAATESTFAQALTIGELSPGPTGLWVVSLGYLLDGVRGALLSALAITLPPLLILLVTRAHDRVKSLPFTRGALDGLILAIAGSSTLVLLRMLAGSGITVTSIAVVVVAFALTLSGRVPSWLIFAAAGAVGLLSRG